MTRSAPEQPLSEYRTLVVAGSMVYHGPEASKNGHGLLDHIANLDPNKVLEDIAAGCNKKVDIRSIFKFCYTEERLDIMDTIEVATCYLRTLDEWDDFIAQLAIFEESYSINRWGEKPPEVRPLYEREDQILKVYFNPLIPLVSGKSFPKLQPAITPVFENFRRSKDLAEFRVKNEGFITGTAKRMFSVCKNWRPDGRGYLIDLQDKLNLSHSVHRFRPLIFLQSKLAPVSQIDWNTAVQYLLDEIRLEYCRLVFEACHNKKNKLEGGFTKAIGPYRGDYRKF